MIQPSHFWVCIQRKLNRIPKKCPHHHVHGSTIHSSQDIEKHPECPLGDEQTRKMQHIHNCHHLDSLRTGAVSSISVPLNGAHTGSYKYLTLSLNGFKAWGFTKVVMSVFSFYLTPKSCFIDEDALSPASWSLLCHDPWQPLFHAARPYPSPILMLSSTAWHAPAFS